MNNENLIKKIKNQFFIIINWNHLEVVKEEPQPIKVYIYNEKLCAEDHQNWSQKTYNVNIMLAVQFSK